MKRFRNAVLASAAVFVIAAAFPVTSAEAQIIIGPGGPPGIGGGGGGAGMGPGLAWGIIGVAAAISAKDIGDKANHCKPWAQPREEEWFARADGVRRPFDVTRMDNADGTSRYPAQIVALRKANAAAGRSNDCTYTALAAEYDLKTGRHKLAGKVTAKFGAKVRVRVGVIQYTTHKKNKHA